MSHLLPIACTPSPRKPSFHYMKVIRVAALALVLSVAATASSPEARRLFQAGQKAERGGDLIRAYLLYSQAVTQDPYNLEFWRRRELVRIPVTLGQSAGMPAEKAPPMAAPPPSAGDFEAQPPPELKALPGRMDLQLRGDARALFTKLAAAYKLDVLFDPDYQAGSELSFRVEQADYREALRTLEAATASFVVPIGERLLLVAKDTPQKRQELEPVVSVSVPVPGALTTQEAQDIMRGVQQAFSLTRVAFDSQHSTILLRDRLARVRPAQELISRLAGNRTLVSVQVEFMEQAHNASTTYGATLQSLFSLAAPAGSTVLSALGSSVSLFRLGITGAQVFAQASRSVGHSLFRVELRSLDGMPASVHVGDRYPIITGRFTSSDTAGQFIIPPAVTFEDLGLSIKVTPRVNSDGEVTLDLDSEFKALTGQVIDELPVVANRKLQSSVRLRAGEWAIATGLMNSTQARTISGLAGFSRVPIVGRALRKNTRESASDEVLILLKPTILGGSDRGLSTAALAVGSEPRPRIPL